MAYHREFEEKLNIVVSDNYHLDNFGVEELANKLYISRSQLYRKLKSIYGKSASTYINEYRLKEAFSLLQDGKFTVSEVSFKVGFSSPSYFSTAFKKHYSYSPIQVRPISSEAGSIEHFPSTDESQHNASAPATIEKILGSNQISKRNLALIVFAFILLLVLIIFFRNSVLVKNTASAKKNQEKSIAVLPFMNYSDDESMDAFCLGMTDEIISRLAKISDFERVISRTSALKYQNMNLDICEIASKLNVNYILEGNIQKTDEKIRVNIQLINALEDDHLWTDQYMGKWESKDIFDIQEKITLFIADALKTVLTSSESIRINENYTTNKEAYILYLQAKFHLYSSDEINMENARNLLIRAIELDSTFAEAYSYVGYTYLINGLAEGIGSQESAWENAKYFFSKAEALDSSLIFTELSLLQGYFYFDWDFSRLESFFHKDFLSYIYDRETSGIIDYAIKTGRHEKALEVINNCIEVNPVDAVLFSFKARALWYLGKKEEATLILHHLDSLNHKDWFYLRESINNHFMMGNYEQSKQLLRIIMDRFQDRSPTILWLELYYAYLDQNMEIVNSALSELHTSYDNEEAGSPAWFIALYHLSVQKDKEKAFEWLEKSFGRKEVELTWFKQDALLAPLKNDDRYWSLYKRIGFDKLEPQ